jgi:tetratricopeptide (TPR) repeat protein
MANNGALYGIIGALGVVVVVGGLYIAKENGAFDPSTIATVTAPSTVPVPAPSPPPAPPPPQAAAPKPAPAPSPPPAAQINQLQLLVTDARRAITRGDFAAADRALMQAERIDPRSTDVIAARRDLHDAQQQAARGENHRIDTLVAGARTAIARHDYPQAERLLDQAEQIDARDHSIRQARAELATARQQADLENRRVDTLVAQARAAIARHDYATADRLLDQAENIDSRDRDVQQARAELNAVQRPRR